MKFVFSVVFVLLLAACRAAVEPLPVTVVPTALPTLISAPRPTLQITLVASETPTPRTRERISPSNINRLKEIGRIERRRGQFHQILWYPDGQHFALTATQGITIYATANFSAATFIPTNVAPRAGISRNGQSIAYLTGGEHLHLLNVETLDEKVVTVSPLSFAYKLEFSPDGREVALATEGRVIFYEAETLEQIANITMPGSVMSFAYSPDGNMVAAGEGYGQIVAWERSNFEPLLDHTLGHASLALLFPSAERLISADGAGILHTWDMVTGKQTHEWQASREGIHKLSLSPDGTLLAAGEDWRVRIFDMASEKQLYEIGTFGLYDIAFSPDGTWFAVVTQDRFAAFYAIE